MYIYISYISCIRWYTCIEIHKLHLHGTPFCVLINRIKAERFSAVLVCGGSLSHIFGPKTLKFFSPDFPWLALTTFKFRFCWLRTGLLDDLNSKMFDIKHGFNWCRVLKIWRQSVLNLWIVIVDLFEFSKRSCSCQLFFASFQLFVMTFGCIPEDNSWN